MSNLTAADFAEDVARKRRALTNERGVIAARLLDPSGIVTDSHISALINVTAKQQILGTMDENITRMLGEGQQDAEVLRLVTEHYERVVHSAWQPNSTSNASVEVDLKKHYYAIEVLNVLQERGFATL